MTFTVLLVKLLDLEGELAFQYDLVVELVPSAERRVFGAGEFCQWMKVEPVYHKRSNVEGIGTSDTKKRVGKYLGGRHDQVVLQTFTERGNLRGQSPAVREIHSRAWCCAGPQAWPGGSNEPSPHNASSQPLAPTAGRALVLAVAPIIWEAVSRGCTVPCSLRGVMRLALHVGSGQLSWFFAFLGT